MVRPLRGSVVPIARLSESDRDSMYRLFTRYYDCVSRTRFDRDLADKDDVILLHDSEEVIQGFSTMRVLRVQVHGRTHYGLFSGDTVVARAHWGQRVLGRVFLRHLVLQKAKRPWSPVWWFLISKGYKTYLLMANNFATHYPALGRETPAHEQGVLDAFSEELFSEYYDSKTGRICFPESLGQLKTGVARITPELRRIPRVAFFEERNPSWAEGSELSCIARMTWTLPLYYSAKASLKLFRNNLGRARLLAAPKTAGGKGR